MAQGFPKPTNVIEKTRHLISMNKRSPDITPKHTYRHTLTHIYKKKKTLATNLTTGYTLCNVNTKDTIRHNIALVTSRSRVYIIYPLAP